MNILGNNAGKLNEVIFENRNKNYGAYEIRSSYNDSLMKSLLCISSFVFLLFGSVFIYNKYNTVTEVTKNFIVDDLGTEFTYVVDITPPSTPHPLPQPHEAAAAKGGVATMIIDEAPTTTTTVNLDNPNSGQGDEGSKGTSLTSTLTSTDASTLTASSGESEKKIIPEVIIADEPPEFDGGTAGLMRYVSQNVVYPSLAREIGREGTVYVSFVVNELGVVESIKVIRGIGYGCDEEVVRVMNKMPKWKKGGKNAGHPVKVRFNIPVSFKLQ